jgi:DNA end-binding protein Ku
MALRSNWDGFIRLNLISVPVRAYSANVSGRGKIGFHLIHKACNSRIKYQKVCPIHGPVPNDEIVSGYEYAKGEYILMDADELKKLRIENDKAITIETFIRPEDLDPIYYTDRTYYLVPNGKIGQEPYAMLQRVMADEQRQALAQVIFAGRQELVLLRPIDRLLAMTMLSYETQIKKPTAFQDEVPERHVSGKELELARNLVEASTTDKLNYADFHDTYTSKVKDLIEAKAAGKKIVVPKPQEEPQIINLMDALRRSLHEAKKGGGAKSRAGSSKAHKRRKTG